MFPVVFELCAAQLEPPLEVATIWPFEPTAQQSFAPKQPNPLSPTPRLVETDDSVQVTSGEVVVTIYVLGFE
jgi:hypothetical protein